MKFDHQEIRIYLQALKDAHEMGEYSQADCEFLGHMYAQGLLYLHVAQHQELFDANAKAGLIGFAKWIRDHVDAPSLDGNSDISCGVKRLLPYANHVRFDSAVVSVATAAFQDFFANLLAGIQTDVMALSVESLDVSPTSKEDAHYAIGMLEITAQNLGAVLSTHNGYTSVDFQNLDSFLKHSCRFIAQVKHELA